VSLRATAGSVAILRHVQKTASQREIEVALPRDNTLFLLIFPDWKLKNIPISSLETQLFLVSRLEINKLLS
jgi:hypothetical protein